MSALEQKVWAGTAYKPFGEFSRVEVLARADELRGAAGWGPTARVGAVAQAWSALALAMEAQGAARVCELEVGTIERLAKPLWVLPPW